MDTFCKVLEFLLGIDRSHPSVTPPPPKSKTLPRLYSYEVESLCKLEGYSDPERSDGLWWVYLKPTDVMKQPIAEVEYEPELNAAEKYLGRGGC